MKYSIKISEKDVNDAKTGLEEELKEWIKELFKTLRKNNCSGMVNSAGEIQKLTILLATFMEMEKATKEFDKE